MRLANLDDVDSILRVERTSYTHPWTAAILKDCIKPGYEVWIVHQPGDSSEIIGYGVISAAAGEAHLLNLCVSSGFRGLGVAAYLLSHLMSRGMLLNADTMFLEVRESNKSAISLYSKVGFNEIGIRRGYYPTHQGVESAIVMACELKLWIE
ncbi:MAG: ribosomal protein S18-alanine N-acetyltransferase [Hahellaceae bacterium]|nr:ribosomal protein S18-alanine N-acetyltransferase [Hahellaceae bacterium]MCP5210780.1 ribosomal protein S18-alanine N-acetyltransferase [Hahellaceae bacterium]